MSCSVAIPCFVVYYLPCVLCCLHSFFYFLASFFFPSSSLLLTFHMLYTLPCSCSSFDHLATLSRCFMLWCCFCTFQCSIEDNEASKLEIIAILYLFFVWWLKDKSLKDNALLTQLQCLVKLLAACKKYTTFQPASSSTHCVFTIK